MPVVLRVGPYKFNFFSGDGVEPPHVHARAGGNEAKFWLRPVQWDSSRGFNTHELNKIRKIIEQNQTMLLEAWSKFFK